MAADDRAHSSEEGGRGRKGSGSRQARSRRRKNPPGSKARRASAQSAPPNIQEQSRRIERDLAGVFFQLLERRRESAGETFSLSRTTLNLTVEVAPPGSGAPKGRLLGELQKAVERCVADRATFPPGRVYCFWCRSHACDHSVPPDPRSVFHGYTATGLPVWKEFMSVLLEKRHPRVDAVVDDDPSPVALVEDGSDLSREQLPVYGKRSPLFHVLGQVTLGYISYPGGMGVQSTRVTERTPLALTFQAVISGNGGRPPVLNILGRLPGGGFAFQAIEESSDSRIWDALRKLRGSLSEVALRSRNGKRHARGRKRQDDVHAVLSRFARNLERLFRQRSRRTQHGRDRHLDRKRPASTALRDALQAGSGSVYRDVEEHTWVVVGPKNRVHVFNDQALHVTSVTYPGETVRQRTTRGRWLAPREEELASFRAVLQAQAARR